MNCPLCSANLIRSKYEGLPVFACEKCSGYLVATRRVMDIEKGMVISPENLLQEARDEDRQDNKQRLRCPRCKRHMHKEHWKRLTSFHIDQCRDCELVWFDAGELAHLQLDYEVKPHVQEAVQFQDRHREMSEEEKAAFERDLAALPEAEGTFAGAFREGLFETLSHLLSGRRRF